ncbi:MAG: hypothetical protein OEY51_02545 [Cyclobacteriaceae bacterium]|nr:hypothetical protein [Cyclobacteriaceae bacterium]
MILEFEDLDDQEVELLLKAPILVSILIAGADNEIDKTEIREAVNISKFRQIKARKVLIEYYKEVGQDFEDKLKILLSGYPVEADKRNPMIVSELEKLNDILPKIDKPFTVELYASLKDIAKKIAEASGGILGYMSVGYEESKYMDLKMIKDPSK